MQSVESAYQVSKEHQARKDERHVWVDGRSNASRWQPGSLQHSKGQGRQAYLPVGAHDRLDVDDIHQALAACGLCGVESA